LAFIMKADETDRNILWEQGDKTSDISC
jgi:hypothetical protein